MEKLPLISVIIPVYNVEEYLDKCISSVIGQTYKNLEIILVDDGSSDRCPQICDSWAQRDKRIRVVHIIHSGGGKARNIALDIACGEFIGFVDSDDYISPIFFESLMDLFDEETEIAECGYLTIESDNAKFAASDNETVKYTNSQALEENIKDRFFRQLIWNKLYRCTVIADIRFPEGKIIDDEFWTYRVIGNANMLIRTDARLYAYRQQKHSVMHMIEPKKRMQALEAKSRRHEYICQYFPELKDESIYSLRFFCIYQGQLLLRTLPRKERRETIGYLKESFKEYPMKLMNKKLKASDYIWMKMADYAFEIVCYLRNFLKIGF